MAVQVATGATAELALLGRPTTPEELQRGPTRRLVAIEVGELRAAIERVLTSTLIERVIEISPKELMPLVFAAERELRVDIRSGRVGPGAPKRPPILHAHVPNAALLRELSRNGRTTTPDDLQRRGRQSVPMIGMSEMSVLIERAVNRALFAHLPPRPARSVPANGGATADTVAAANSVVAEEHVEAPAELVDDSLAASRLQVAHYRLAVEQELGALRASVAAHRGFAEQQESVDNWPLDAERRDDLKLRIHARLMPVFDQLPRGSISEHGVVADLMALFAEERAVELAAARRAADVEVVQLERRISKLMASLEANEALLESVAAAKYLDPGVASQYRTVQGLDPAIAERQRRLAMLDAIFKMNVELQSRVTKVAKRASSVAP